MAIFSHAMVVGNLITIMATIDVWWHYDYWTLFWVTCVCPFLDKCSCLYVYMFEATMAVSNDITTHKIMAILLDAFQVWLLSFITN